MVVAVVKTSCYQPLSFVCQNADELQGRERSGCAALQPPLKEAGEHVSVNTLHPATNSRSPLPRRRSARLIKNGLRCTEMARQNENSCKLFLHYPMKEGEGARRVISLCCGGRIAIEMMA